MKTLFSTLGCALVSAMAFAQTGNVGIGTTTPAARLHVADGSVLFNLPTSSQTVNPPPVSGPGSRMMWYADKAAFRAGFVNGPQWDGDSIGYYSFSTGADNVAKGDYSTAAGSANVVSGNYTFATGVGNQVAASFSSAIGAGNKVSGEFAFAAGINNHAAGFYSTVVGHSSATSGEVASAFGLADTATGNASMTLGSGLKARSWGEVVTGIYNEDYVPVNGALVNATDRVFVVGNGTGNAARSNALTVLKNGNVGIGISAPTQKLSVAGAVAATSFSGDGGALAGVVNTTSAQSVGGVKTFSSNLIANGNVGIGIATPAARLHITDSSVLASAAGPAPATPGAPPVSGAGRRMMWYANKGAFRAGYVAGTQWDWDSVGIYSLAVGANNKAKGISAASFGTDNSANGAASLTAGLSNHTTATGSGSVALGQRSYAADVAAIAAGFVDTATASAAVALGGGAIARSWGEVAVGTYNEDYAPTSTASVFPGDRVFVVGNGTDPTARSNAMTILKSGAVGIGTSAPHAPLQFSNSIANRKIVLFEGGNNDHQFYGFGIDGGALRYQTDHTGADHVFFSAASTTSSSELMRIKGTGNVGIGTSAPTARLHVAVTGGAAPGLFSATDVLTGGATAVLRGEYVGSALLNYAGVEGYNVPGNVNNGIGVSGEGGYMGVKAVGRADASGDVLGVYANALSNGNAYGVFASALPHLTTGGTKIGVYGVASGGNVNWAGLFAGDVQVIGALSKGGGTFKIDHPQDPENKYLYHSFVESPDMMNIYNGNIVTDAAGYSTVQLPDYFDALNKDFRYSLTVVDASDDFVLAKVTEKISGNRFRIRTSKPGVEVSWQVTGVRKDAWANENRVVPVIEKAAEERGTYLHPTAFGKPEGAGTEYQRRKKEEDTRSHGAAAAKK